RDREPTRRASPHRRRRDHRRTPSRAGRGGEGGRTGRAGPRRRADRDGRARVGPGRARRLQGAGVRRDPRRAPPPQRLGQAPEERAARRGRGHLRGDAVTGTQLDPTPAVDPTQVPLPPQPTDVPWPTGAWPRTEPPAAAAPALGPLLDAVMEDTARYGTTYAVAVV